MSVPWRGETPFEIEARPCRNIKSTIEISSARKVRPIYAGRLEAVLRDLQSDTIEEDDGVVDDDTGQSQLNDQFARPINQILAQERRFEEEPRREELFRLLRAFLAGFKQNR